MSSFRERRPEPEPQPDPDPIRENLPNGNHPMHIVKEDMDEIERKIQDIEHHDIGHKENEHKVIEQKENEFKANDDDQEWGHCLTPECHRRNIVYDKRLDCTSCGMSWCIQCGVEWHLGQTCAQYQADMAIEQNGFIGNGLLGNVNELYGGMEEQQFQAMYQAQYDADKMRTCKQCYRVIEKDGGCNHMTCVCGYHFCWLCDQEVDPEHLEKHYEIGVCLLNEVDAV